MGEKKINDKNLIILEYNKIIKILSEYTTILWAKKNIIYKTYE